MFGWFEIKSPLTAEQRRWIDTRFAWLRNEFGEERLRGVVITPTQEFFPDRYRATEEDAAVLLDRCRNTRTRWRFTRTLTASTGHGG